MAFNIASEIFSGPFQKLLELIEGKHMDVSRVSIAAVTEDFLVYATNLEGRISAEELAEFLVVAAKLMLIKSKLLIPSLSLSSEEEKDMTDFEAHIAIYTAVRNAGNAMGRAFKSVPELFARSLFMGEKNAPRFTLPADLNSNDLARALELIFAILNRTLETVHPVRSIYISIEETMTELLHRLSQGAGSMKAAAHGATREKTVALFLAILHLVKSAAIHIEQREPFGDIMIRRI